MANSGCDAAARPLAERFLEIFRKYDHVVSPSGSCVSMVRNHYDHWLHGKPRFEHLRDHTFELCEYLTDIAKVVKVDGEFPHKVGLQMSCHGLRELRLARSSEQMIPPFNKVRQLLTQLRGIEVVELSRPDECCGFGGTFAVKNPDVSAAMGADKVRNALSTGADVLCGADNSCLLHIGGTLRRADAPMRTVHLAEILACTRADPTGAGWGAPKARSTA
jgi:L-lactate dehydrogenase complex protein LldE